MRFLSRHLEILSGAKEEERGSIVAEKSSRATENFVVLEGSKTSSYVHLFVTIDYNILSGHNKSYVNYYLYHLYVKVKEF